LARLIGQSDPYTDLGQNVSRRADPPQREAESMDWRKAVAAMPPFENLQSDLDDSRVAQHRSSHGDFERGRDPYYPAAMDTPRSGRPVDDNYDRPFPAEPHYPQSDHYQPDREIDPYSNSAHEAGPRSVDRYDSTHQDADHHDGGHYDAGHYDNGRLDGGRLGNRHDGDMRQPPSVPIYQEGTPLGPREGAMYDDPPRSRGRNGLITAATLVACAVVGTAAAYGYRTFVGAGAPKNPPIITAESTPSKVPGSLDSQQNKVIQDRVRDQGQGERLVSREEQPVDVRGSGPRAVLPSPYAPTPSFGSPPSPGGGNPPSGGGALRGGQQSAATPGSPASTGAIGEPKSVRTIPIRPDGNDLNGRPVTGTTPALTPARPTTAPKNAQPGRGAPASLDPPTAGGQVNAPAPAIVPDQPRLASVPTNVAPAAGPTGTFMVQLSSQKSEGEAQASFRSLQAKYPDQLGGRSAMVRRADLGERGIFYRAMVGPFGSSEDASKFCSNLKAAGGNCIIQRN